jgi:acetyl esterase/lipase
MASAAYDLGAGRPLPALLWIHCGGYVLGSADRVDMCVSNLVASMPSASGRYRRS